MIRSTYGVPDLKFDILLVDLDGSRSEFDTYGQIVLLSEALVRELEQEAGLTYTWKGFRKKGEKGERR